jgi:hypothetical protein
MVFLSPWDVVIDFFILLPIDIIWYMTQVFTWLGLNAPVLFYYSIYGWDILYGRLYWIALYIIFHFDEFKESTGLEIIWAYVFWWFYIFVWYANYLSMAFGWSYIDQDTGSFVDW